MNRKKNRLLNHTQQSERGQNESETNKIAH